MSFFARCRCMGEQSNTHTYRSRHVPSHSVGASECVSEHSNGNCEFHVNIYIRTQCEHAAAPPLQYGCLSASAIGGKLSIESLALAAAATAQSKRTRSQTLFACQFHRGWFHTRTLLAALTVRADIPHCICVCCGCAFSHFSESLFVCVCQQIQSHGIGSTITTCFWLRTNERNVSYDYDRTKKKFKRNNAENHTSERERQRERERDREREKSMKYTSTPTYKNV